MRCSTLAESARLNVAGAQQEKSLSLLSSDAKLNSKPCPSLPMSGLRSCSRSRAKPGRVCVEHRQLANIRYIYTGTCNAVLGKGKAPRWARAHPCAKGLQKLPQNQLYVERTCRCFRFTWSKVVIISSTVSNTKNSCYSNFFKLSRLFPKHQTVLMRESRASKNKKPVSNAHGLFKIGCARRI